MDRPYIEDYPGDIEGDEKPNFFLQYTNCPAVILEPDFVSQLVNIAEKEDSACIAIAESIFNYLEE